jgi:hypothetical protein
VRRGLAVRSRRPVVCWSLPRARRRERRPRRARRCAARRARAPDDPDDDVSDGPGWRWAHPWGWAR